MTHCAIYDMDPPRQAITKAFFFENISLKKEEMSLYRPSKYVTPTRVINDDVTSPQLIFMGVIVLLDISLQ